MTSNVTEIERPVNNRLIPVATFDRYYPWPTPQSIRNRINKAKRGEDPAFLSCIRRVGGRVLIDESAFQAWLAKESGPSAA